MLPVSCFLTPPVVPRTGSSILRAARATIRHTKIVYHLRSQSSSAVSQSAGNVTDNIPSPSPSVSAAKTSSTSRSSIPLPSYAPEPDQKLPPLPQCVRSSGEMPPRYDPQIVEQDLYAWWESSGLFRPCAPNGKEPFTVCMRPPNVVGVLHMGHARFAALQDILTRFHRMRGRLTLWLPGADHAGIAAQLVVEKALAAQGISRLEIGRKQFLQRVWEWKTEKGGYITHCGNKRSLKPV